MRLIYSILHRRSHLPLTQKRFCYMYLLRPIWTYATQIYGTTKPTNIKRIQTFQNRFLRQITNCPYYVTNTTLHRDLNIETVQQAIKKLYKTFNLKLRNHINPYIQSLSSPHLPDNAPRRLRRRWSRDLL